MRQKSEPTNARRRINGSGTFCALLPAKKVKEFCEGETIVTQGERCTDVYYIEQGAAKLMLVAKNGKRAVLGIAGEGDFLGESCIANESYHSNSAVALVCSKVRIISIKEMNRLLAEEPYASKYFTNYLIAKKQRIEADLIDQMLNVSERRLARILLLLAKSQHVNSASSVLDSLDQDTLAEMVGTTRSRVNYFMNKFRRLGYIHYNGGLTVYDSLARILHE